jgi:co-chaperonin GroES (HSP10)
MGGRVIVQLRRIKKTSGRIIIVDETKENEKWNNMIGKVVAFGPLAYKNRDTMTSWPEGSWAEIGDFVRVPRWGGDTNFLPVIAGTKTMPQLLGESRDLLAAAWD